MCVIGIYENEFPKAEDLISMESLNSDGAGISWIKNGWVYWKKGITAKDIIQDIKLGEIKLPMIVHFRIRSSGKKVRELTHPFKCHEGPENFLSGKTRKPLLFHNGTVSNWTELIQSSIAGSKSKIPDGELSDSRALSFLVARHGINYLALVGGYNKFAVMTPEGIHKFGEWNELSESKALVSNNYWKMTEGIKGQQFTNSYLIKKSQGLDTKDEDDVSDYADSTGILTGYHKPKSPIQSYRESRKQKIPKRLRKDWNKSGYNGLSEKQKSVLYSTFNPNLLSWEQWGIYDELIDSGFNKEYLAKMYYENGCDFQTVRNEIWFDEYDGLLPEGINGV